MSIKATPGYRMMFMREVAVEFLTGYGVAKDQPFSMPQRVWKGGPGTDRTVSLIPPYSKTYAASRHSRRQAPPKLSAGAGILSATCNQYRDVAAIAERLVSLESLSGYHTTSKRGSKWALGPNNPAFCAVSLVVLAHVYRRIIVVLGLLHVL